MNNTKKIKDETDEVNPILDVMKDCKEVTVKVAEELGFEHRGEPSAAEVKEYLTSVDMGNRDYALLRKMGGKLLLCLSTLNNLCDNTAIPRGEMAEAANLADYAFVEQVFEKAA